MKSFQVGLAVFICILAIVFNVLAFYNQQSDKKEYGYTCLFSSEKLDEYVPTFDVQNRYTLNTSSDGIDLLFTSYKEERSAKDGWVNHQIVECLKISADTVRSMQKSL